MKIDLPTTDLMTHYLAKHVARKVMRVTRADGLDVRQAIEPKNDGIDLKLQSIWAIWDERRDLWLEVYVDPDNVPL